MDVRIIFSDLDNTLLRNDRSVSPYTREVIARCLDRGIMFFAATARPPRALHRKFISDLPRTGFICHNGGVVVMDGEVAWEQGFSKDLALPIARALIKEYPNVRLSAEISDTLYANFDGREIWGDVGTEHVFTDFSDLPDAPLDKLIVGLDFPDIYDRVLSLLPGELAAQKSDNVIITIQPKGIEKGKAVAAICEKLGVSKKQTVAFGDDWNDIPLLDACGTGVAVENALPEVKEKADFICLSNDEDGPAHWIEENILK